MKDFIFGVFCYNQENYIIENLESIKYQIVNHGKDINCSIVIGDDCSKDRTLKYIKLWLYENKNVFSHIKIIDSPSNKGVVGNYISLLKNIDTNNFKILAGDDLYYKNNIFSVLGDENIVISPMLRFHEKKVIREQRYNLKKFMVISDKQKYITNELKFNNCLESPGVFLDKRLFDEALYTELEKYKWINFVVGTHMLDKLCEEVYKSINDSRLDIVAPSIEGNIIEDLPVKRESKYKAYINIQLGCDKFCTYCIVPYTRGKQRSRRKEDILNEVNALKNEGYKEITLLGQNVNAYGKDLYDNYTMANLLEDVALTGMERIRFITSHPWDFTDEMIEVIKKYPNVLNHVHLPVQSGNSDILKLMGRRYTKEEYLNLYKKLKEQIPNISITTDIIVGFPGETNKQFEDTLSLVEECKFDLAYTFIYSPREGTPAAKMEDNVPLSDKEQRLYRLNELVNKYANEANQKYLGQVVKVLVEGPSKKNPDVLSGYTEHNKLINFKGDASMVGQIVDVRVTEAKTWALTGEQLESNN